MDQVEGEAGHPQPLEPGSIQVSHEKPAAIGQTEDEKNRDLAVVGWAPISAWRGSSHPRSGLWPRVFRGSPESARAQAAGDGQLLPLLDPCPSSTRSQRRLPLPGMGSALVARLWGGRDPAVLGWPDRGVAH